MSTTKYVYIPAKSGEPATVGFYDPDGKWIAESDHSTDEEAAERVHWLNGGHSPSVMERIDKLEEEMLSAQLEIRKNTKHIAAYAQP